MGPRSLWLCLAAGVLIAARLPAAPVPLEVFGHLPSLEEVELSPDGSRIAFIKTQGESRLLVIASIADHKKLAGFVLGQTKLRALRWADNEHLLIMVSSTAVPRGLVGMRDEWAQLFYYDVATQKLKNVVHGLIEGPSNVMNTVDGLPMIRRIDGETVLFATGFSGAGVLVPTLFRIQLNSGFVRIVASGFEDSRGWFVDADGHVIAEERYRSESQLWTMLLHWRDQPTRSVAGHEAIDIPSIAGISPDGQGLWISLFEGGEWVWKPLSLADGTWGDRPASAQGLESVFTDRYTDRIIGGQSYTGQVRYTFFDQKREDAWTTIMQTYPDSHARYVSSSEDFSKVVILVEPPRAAPEYQLVDLDTARAQPLGPLYEGLSQSAEVRAISYPAQDGLRISAYLTLPPDRPANNLPLVVLPHGGPAARDTGEFDWWSQALASQGYAVLQPNFRGSDLSWSLLSAGFGQWGRKMQTDLSDGVRHLAADGLIDPKRVCIVGASYGGYAAMAGVSIESGLYRCAVAVSGISDLHRFLDFLGEKTGRNSRSDRYTDRFLGASGPKDPTLDAISPIRHVDAIVSPVLLIHGRDDTVVPFEQSQMLADALRKAGKPVTLVELKQEDHWLSHGDTRLQMLEATVKFLKENNPPD